MLLQVFLFHHKFQSDTPSCYKTGIPIFGGQIDKGISPVLLQQSSD